MRAERGKRIRRQAALAAIVLLTTVGGFVALAGEAQGSQAPAAAQASPEAPQNIEEPEAQPQPGNGRMGCMRDGGCDGCGRGQGKADGPGGRLHHGMGSGAMDGGGGMRGGRGMRGGHGMHGGQGPHRAGGGCRPEMESIWTLIDSHEAIERRVEEIPGGVRTVTITEDPELLSVLRRHAAEMAELMESGGRIRMWDPLFAELLSRSDAVRMEVLETENGVTVVETSEDPEVTRLIRAHAAKVEEFVARGPEAYREETPLPEGYESAPRMP